MNAGFFPCVTRHSGRDSAGERAQARRKLPSQKTKREAGGNAAAPFKRAYPHSKIGNEVNITEMIIRCGKPVAKVEARSRRADNLVKRQGCG